MPIFKVKKLTCVTALLFVFSSLEAQQLIVKAGAPVAAELEEGIMVQGTAKAVGASGVDFVAKDGRKKTLPIGKVVPFIKDAVFKAGEKVLGIYEGDVMLYEAKVKKAEKAGYVIAWDTDDGSEMLSTLKAEELVRVADFGKATAAPAGGDAPKKAAPRSAFSAGDLVAALFNDGNWYKGEVDSVDNGRYVINTVGGRQSTQPADRLRLLGGDPGVKVGDRVAALYGSEKFYGGTVQRLDEGGILIKWDDGTKPSLVQKGNVIALVGEYDYKEAPKEDPAQLLSFTLNSVSYSISRKTGRVNITGGWVGTYEFDSGKLDAFSSYNANGIIGKDGRIDSWHNSAYVGGYLEEDGDLVMGGKHILTISDAAFGGRKLTWDERRMIAIIIVVYAMR